MPKPIVELTGPDYTDPIDASELATGEFAKIVSGVASALFGSVVLKTGIGLVIVRDTSEKFHPLDDGWHLGHWPSEFRVRRLPPGTTLTIRST